MSKNMKNGCYRKKSLWVQDPRNERRVLGESEIELVKIAEDLMSWVDNSPSLFSIENSHRARRNNFVDALADSLGLKMAGADPFRGNPRKSKSAAALANKHAFLEDKNG